MKKGEDEAPSTRAPSGESPFDRFANFTRRILAVPKAELDEKERAYKKEGRHTRKPRPAG